jgi:alkaline phosphatase
MTIKAIEVMSSKCSDGFFLLAEAALIDKSMHAIDYDRGLAEILELDRTVKAVKDWADSNKSKGETGIIVTADHAQAFDVYGSVDTEYFNSLPDDDSNLNPNPSGNQKTLQYQKRQSIGEYDLAGWPDLVTDEKGLPTKWKGRYKLAAGKVDALPHKEDFQLKQTPVKGTNPLTRQSAIKDVALSTMYNVSYVMVESPNEKGIYISPSLPVESTSTVHSLQSVDLYCYGPAAFRIECSRVMDNTELFFIMADALGLGQDGSRKSSVPFGSTENDNFKAVVQ